MNNWFDCILYHTRAQPETPAMVMEDRTVTYGMLGAAIERCARRIVALNIAPEGLVAVQIKNPIRDLTVSLALFRIGLRSISVVHGQPGIEHMTFAAVLGDRDAARFFDPAARLIEVTDAWFGEDVAAGGELPALRRWASVSPELDVRRDRHAKGRQSPRCGCRAARPQIHGPQLDVRAVHARAFVGLRLYHGLHDACRGSDAVVRQIAVSGDPHDRPVLDRLHPLFDRATGGAHARRAQVGSSSAQPSQHMGRRQRSDAGAARSRHDPSVQGRLLLLRRVRDGTIAGIEAREVLLNPGLVGHVQPGVEVGIFDASGKRCSVGEIGAVKTRLCDDESSPASVAKPWIDLGDLGWIAADGRLYVMGRSGDVDSPRDTPAGRVSPVHEVEHLLRLEWDLTDAAAVLVEDGSGEQPQIWIGVVDNRGASAEKIAAAARLRGIGYAIRLFDLKAIPRGANGKVSRAQLKTLLLAATSKPAMS